MFFTGMKQTIRNITKQRNKTLPLMMAVGLCAGVITTSGTFNPTDIAVSTSADIAHGYIVSAKNYAKLQDEMNKLEVTPSHNLKIINALAVKLTDQQLTSLKTQLDVTVTKNHQVELAGWAMGQRKWNPAATVGDFINASSVHATGNYGAAVTIGFLDTGIDNLVGTGKDLYGNDKYWGTYDAITDITYNEVREQNGHGTHVSSIAGNSDFDVNGKIYGVAPNAKLVGIKAFDSQGHASYADIIRGIGWAVTNKDTINLRVLNMSFNGPAVSHYWEDPVNLAVMQAWQAGIVVVASAGNKGPDPMTIGVPGNNPYIITVGAMTDNYTPTDFSDDKLADFSSAGPTVEGFVKPDLIAPGGHMSGLMATDTYIPNEYPEFHDGGRYFEMSGTSQAAAVVSGVAALILTNNPSLTPDDVKCRLIASARSALKNDGKRAYSVFQQGAGVVDAPGAVNSTVSGCANQALDIAADIAGTRHFKGPANINSNGDIFIEGLNADFIWDIPTDLQDPVSQVWRDAITTDGGFIWQTAFDTDGGFIWQTAFDVDGGFIWQTAFNTSGGFIWQTSADFTSSDPIGINVWVGQQ